MNTAGPGGAGTEDCKHGFPLAMCAECRPRAVPDRPAAAQSGTARGTVGRQTPRRAAPSSSIARVSRATPGRDASPSLGAPIDPATIRVWRAVAVVDLANTVAVGSLRPDAGPGSGAGSGSDSGAGARSGSDSGTDSGAGREADTVSFFLAPEAALGVTVPVENAGAAWRPSDWVILGLSVGEVLAACEDPTEQSARSTLASSFQAELGDSLAAGWSAVAARLGAWYRYRPPQHPPGAVLRVAASVPWTAVTVVAVPHDPARDRVRALVGPAVRVAVHPPWFQPR